MSASGDPLREILLEALPFIARSTGGTALLADHEGVRIMTVDQDGRELTAEKGTVHELSRKAAQQGRPLFGPATRHPSGYAWALPLGRYVLAASDGDRIARESQLRSSLQAALPLIAKVAGGEAVLFDQEGRRLMSAMPDGSTDPARVGWVSEMCRKTMETGVPNISPSTTAPGAMAVRIPITREFGFGFNNMSIRQKEKVHEELRAAGPARYTWSDIITQSPAMRNVLTAAKRAAPTSAPIWILGETGTGKELLAQAIHNGSPRRGKPFVAVNCAALPSGLAESILFGYAEGAFTGAKRGGHPGLFEQANGGTLFLDEIGEMDVTLQAKLLRALQEREVTRVGCTRVIRVDVRVIAATNRDLLSLVRSNRFRADLYYRLNVVDLRLPPLRERREDIPLLANRFLHTCAAQAGRPVHRIDPEALKVMMNYAWPGNIRELYNCIERAVILAPGETIRREHLPYEVVSGGPDQGPYSGASLEQALRKAEREIIRRVLQECGGNKSCAAHRLGISMTTLWRKLREFGEETGAACSS